MRIQVRMKMEHKNYRKGERLNLPAALAEDLIKKGAAEKLTVIGRGKKAAGAPEKKVVVPPENKSAASGSPVAGAKEVKTE